MLRGGLCLALVALAARAFAADLPPVQLQEREDWRDQCAIGIVPVPFAEGCIVIARGPTRCLIYIKPKPSKDAVRRALELCEREAQPK